MVRTELLFLQSSSPRDQFRSMAKLVLCSKPVLKGDVTIFKGEKQVDDLSAALQKKMMI